MAIPHRYEEEADLEQVKHLSRGELRTRWAQELGAAPPTMFGRDILGLGLAYARQERLQVGLRGSLIRELDWLLDRALRDVSKLVPQASVALPRAGTILVSEWQGTTHHVTVVDDGFVWNGQTHASLSSIARAITGTKWNGPRFFGMRESKGSRVEEPRHGAK